MSAMSSTNGVTFAHRELKNQQSKLQSQINSLQEEAKHIRS